MKNAKKLSALVLAAAMAVSASGCGDQSWSYRAGDVSLTTGTYIYNLLNGYYEASDLVESPDEVKDILKAEVTGTDGDSETKTVEQYAYDEADETSVRMIAIESLFNKYGLTLDETEDQAARNYATQVWSTAKKMFEGYGVSEESFTYCYADYSVKYGQVFEYLYSKDGEKSVSDDELKAYFAENYKGYAYFNLSMAETDSNDQAVAKSDAEFEKAESDFAGYVDMINKGSDYKSVVSKYIKDYDYQYDPTYSGSLKNDNDSSAIDADVVKTIRSLDEGKATMITTGEAATTQYYFVYRPKNSEIEDYLNTESTTTSQTFSTDEINIYDLKSGYTRFTMLDDMKSDDFKDYLKTYADSLGIEKNETALKSYKPKMFVTKDSD